MYTTNRQPPDPEQIAEIAFWSIVVVIAIIILFKL